MRGLVEVIRAMPAAALLALVGCASSFARDDARLSAIPERGSLLTVGETWSCWASPRGELVCWGMHPADQEWWERTHERVGNSPSDLVDLQIGRNAACVLDRESRLSCWSAEPDSEFAIAGADDVSLAEGAACAVFEHREVRCALLDDGEAGGRWQTVAGIEGTISDLHVRQGGAGCATVDGRPWCWGPRTSSLAAYPMRAIDHDWTWSFGPRNIDPALRRSERAQPMDFDSWTAYGQVEICGGDSICDFIDWNAANVLTSLRAVALAGSVGCGLDAHDRAVCAWYGTNDDLPRRTRSEIGALLQVPEFELERGVLHRISDDPVSAIAVGADHACAIGPAGEVHCWGADDHCQSEVPELASPDPCLAVQLRHGDAIEVLRWSDAEARLGIHRNAWRERGVPFRASGRNLPELEARCLPGHRKPRACTRLPPTIQPLPTFEPTVHRLVRDAGRLGATGMLASPDGRVFDEPRVHAHLLDAQGRELGIVAAKVACTQLQAGGCPWAIEPELEPEGTVEVRLTADAQLFLPALQASRTTIEIEIDAAGYMVGPRGLGEIVVTDVRPHRAARDFFQVTVADGSWSLADPIASIVGFDRQGRVIALLPVGIGPLQAPGVLARFELPASDEIVDRRLRIEGRLVFAEPNHRAGSTSG